MAFKSVVSNTATQGLQFYDNSSGTVSVVTTPAKYGYSLKLDASGGTQARAQPSVPSSVADVGVVVFWFYFDSAPTSTMTFYGNGNINIDSVSARATLRYRLGTDRILRIANDAFNGNEKAGTTALSTATWYRVAIASNWISSTNWSAKIYVTSLDNTLPSAEVSASNADFSTDGGNHGAIFASGPNVISYFTDSYWDDRSDLSDPGDIRVTAKLPNANNVNSFNTNIGANPANRWTNVNERALSETNGWKDTSGTEVAENYTLESSAGGDIDISSKTIVGRSAWVWAKAAPYANTTSTSVTSSTKATTTVLPSVTVALNDVVVIAFHDQIGGTNPTAAKTAGTSTIGAVTAADIPTNKTSIKSVWYFTVTGAGTLTITFTHDNSSAKRVGVLGAFPNLTSTSNVPDKDKNPANTSDNTSQYDSASSGTLTQANELVIGVFGFAGPTSDGTPTAVSPSSNIVTDGTTGGSATTNAQLLMTMQPVNATTAVTMSATRAVDRNGVQAIITFKAASDIATLNAKLTDNGADTAKTLTGISALYTVITTSATYPSNAAGIGMKSIAGYNNTFLYECGTLIVYNNAAAVITPFVPQSWLIAKGALA